MENPRETWGFSFAQNIVCEVYIDYYIFGTLSEIRVATLISLVRLNITRYNILCTRSEVKGKKFTFYFSLPFEYTACIYGEKTSFTSASRMERLT